MGTKSGPQEAIESFVEETKGKIKEIIGIIFDRDGLKKEGQSQQDKAKSLRNAVKKEVQADSARAAAKASEAREKAHQN
ncbi:MAG: hypothetical protein QOH60_2350 [Mycobacterium sp.]|jgi:uncharacterized protein YjbJ (UPF0337 family)|nr:hypothetical protein [Mycobacterium sp.]